MVSTSANWSHTCSSLHAYDLDHQTETSPEPKSSSLPSYSVLVIHIHQCSSITVSRCTETYFGEFFEHQQEIGNCEGEYCSHLQGKRCGDIQVILVYRSVFYKTEDYWISSGWKQTETKNYPWKLCSWIFTIPHSCWQLARYPVVAEGVPFRSHGVYL